MKLAIGLSLACATVCLTGCSLFHHHRAPMPAPAPLTTSPPPAKPVIEPDLRITGKVAMVNKDGHFAIITFPAGSVPANGAHLNVYRNGSKVGEMKVTGPQRETDTVADIVAGDVQIQDEARVE